MKKILLSTFTFLSQFVFAQSYEVKYIRHVLSHKQAQIPALLVINDSIAEYTYYQPSKKFKYEIGLVTLDFHKFKNQYSLSDNRMTEQRTLKNGALIRAEWQPNYEWKIENEFKTIKGYKVQKATTKSIESSQNNPYYEGDVTAWFTTEIPISAGPSRYVGLPGLILEIKYEKYGSNGIELLEIKEINKADFTDISTGTVFPKEDVIYFDHYTNADKIKKLKK